MSNSEDNEVETPSESESNSFIDQANNPNMDAVEIVNESDVDLCVEVKHCESSISEKDYETLNSTEENETSTTLAHESASESDVDDGKTFQQRCLKELKETDLLDTIVSKLDDTNNLQDFMTLLRNLATGQIPMDNIVFLLMLERAKFQSCKNTVCMRYRKVTKVFWSIVYRLCKGAGLKFFSGEKNWGQVVGKECARSNYNPNKSKINFAVPSERVLRNFDEQLPKIIPPGKIHKCLNLLKGEKDIVLMADGKLVTKGLKEHFCGDVNLFGHEVNPNIAELKEEIQKHLNFVSQSLVNFKICDEVDKYGMVRDLTNCITGLIGQIRKFVSHEQKRLRGYTKSVFSEQKYVKVISSCKTNLYTSFLWLKKALQLNVKLLNLMSTIQRNSHIFASSTQKHLSECYNIRLLHSAEYVMSKVDPIDYPHLIKDGSDMFLDLKRQSLITCDSVYNCLGLYTSKAMKLHFRQYVQETLDIENNASHKYSGISTLINIIMPSLLLLCSCELLNQVHSSSSKSYLS